MKYREKIALTFLIFSAGYLPNTTGLEHAVCLIVFIIACTAFIYDEKEI